MTDDFGSIEIRYDMEMHPDQEEPSSRAGRIEWAYLDTAYKLIRIASVREIFEGVRQQLTEAGLSSRTDEEILAGAGEGVTYIDLAANDDLACGFVALAYSQIRSATAQHAGNGLAIAQAEDVVERLARELGVAE